MKILVLIFSSLFSCCLHYMLLPLSHFSQIDSLNSFKIWLFSFLLKWWHCIALPWILKARAINLVGNTINSFEHDVPKSMLNIALLKMIWVGQHIIFGKNSINLVCVEKVGLKIFLKFYRIVRIVPIYYLLEIYVLCSMYISKYIFFVFYLLFMTLFVTLCQKIKKQLLR